MKTVSCPSCGASATNHQNCEFCGSLFVRATQLNYDLNNFSLIEVENNSYSGLKEELDLNLLLREQYKCDYFHTEIYKSRLDWLNLTTENGDGILRVHNLTIDGKILKNSLSIEIMEFALSPSQIAALKGLKEFVFFDYEYDPSGNGYWLMNFGSDTSGAAYFISTLLREVYQIDPQANVYAVTIAENLFTDNQDDNRWWVEKASQEYKDRYNRGAEKFGYYTRNEDGSYNNSQGKSGCFIATATMGDYDHPEVMELRHLRDEWILNKSWGNSFVKWYYHYGAIAARVIEKSTILKKVSYITIVKPLVYLSRVVNQK